MGPFYDNEFSFATTLPRLALDPFLGGELPWLVYLFGGCLQSRNNHWGPHLIQFRHSRFPSMPAPIAGEELIRTPTTGEDPTETHSGFGLMEPHAWR